MLPGQDQVPLEPSIAETRSRRRVAPRRDMPQACVERRHGNGPGAPSRQQGKDPPYERDLAIPSRPAAYRIVIQGGFEAASNGPARIRHAHDLCHRRVWRGPDHRGRQLGGCAAAPPDQQPPIGPPNLQASGQGPSVPVIPAEPCGPVTALRRVQPSWGSAARSVLLCRCSPSRQTDSWTNTAGTKAWRLGFQRWPPAPGRRLPVEAGPQTA